MKYFEKVNPNITSFLLPSMKISNKKINIFVLV